MFCKLIKHAPTTATTTTSSTKHASAGGKKQKKPAPRLVCMHGIHRTVTSDSETNYSNSRRCDWRGKRVENKGRRSRRLVIKCCQLHRRGASGRLLLPYRPDIGPVTLTLYDCVCMYIDDHSCVNQPLRNASSFESLAFKICRAVCFCCQTLARC